MSLELVKSAADWPEKYILVMQSHTPRSGYWSQAYLNEVVRATDPKRVIISFDPVSPSDFRTMLDSADVGLAFYTPQASIDSTQGRNVHLMGFSSGKFANYLYCGLPVVVNDAGVGPNNVVEKWGCGFSVNTSEQIRTALNSIFSSYDTYSENAIRCFNQELELGSRFQDVIDRIDQFTEITNRC
jgi:glycosyltransferase involved in cell wall biosynthesis